MFPLKTLSKITQYLHYATQYTDNTRFNWFILTFLLRSNCPFLWHFSTPPHDSSMYLHEAAFVCVTRQPITRKSLIYK